MHELRLGTKIIDCVTGEERENTSYEDLRQSLAGYFLGHLGYASSVLATHVPVAYMARGSQQSREIDLAVYADDGSMLFLLVFCPGQCHTFVREVTALARLVSPMPCPIASVTDTREIEIFAVKNGELLGNSLQEIPIPANLGGLAQKYAFAPLSSAQREMESRILDTYTGFLKTCCSENSSFIPSGTKKK